MGHSNAIGWYLVITGLVIAGIGVLWILAPSLPWLGKLPGDIRLESGSVRVYVPIVTCLLLGAFLTAILWIIQWLRR